MKESKIDKFCRLFGEFIAKEFGTDVIDEGDYDNDTNANYPDNSSSSSKNIL